jgi:hypothetical protein
MSFTLEQTTVNPPEYSKPPGDLVYPGSSIKGIAGKEESTAKVGPYCPAIRRGL